MPQAGIGGRWSWFVDRIAASWRVAARLRGVRLQQVRSTLARLLRGFPTQAEQLRKLVTSVALVGGIVVGTWMIVDLSNDEPLVFDPIYVHPNLANRMPPGERLALRTGAHFDRFTAAVERLRERNDSALKPDTDLPKLDIPGAEISVQAVVQIVRRFLGLRERHIGGEIFLSKTPVVAAADEQGTVSLPPCPGGPVVYVVARLSVNRGELAEPAELAICSTNVADAKGDFAVLDANVVESLLHLAALRAYERVNPCGSAAYYFHNWYQRSLDGRALDPEFRHASKMVGTCLAKSGFEEAAYAHHVLGRIRQASGRSREAPRFFESAERLHLGAHSGWRRWLHRKDVWHIHLPADLYAHWGSALMDIQQPAEARQMFDKQIRYGSRSALGFIGKGNAQVVLAGDDPRKLAEAVSVYCEGARRYRFDAAIRHALADLLEAHAALRGCRRRPVDRQDYILELRQKAVDLIPTEPAYLLALGKSQRMAGKGEDAEVTYKQLLGLGGKDTWRAYAALADIYAAGGERERAAETRRHATQARLRLACTEWRSGYTDAARDHLLAIRQIEDQAREAIKVDTALAACIAEIQRSATDRVAQ